MMPWASRSEQHYSSLAGLEQTLSPESRLRVKLSKYVRYGQNIVSETRSHFTFVELQHQLFHVKIADKIFAGTCRSFVGIDSSYQFLSKISMTAENCALTSH